MSEKTAGQSASANSGNMHKAVRKSVKHGSTRLESLLPTSTNKRNRSASCDALNGHQQTQ
jgi:hypothetical protein